MNDSTTTALGAGTVLSASPQADLHAKLAKNTPIMAGSEQLSPVLRFDVNTFLTSAENSSSSASLIGSVVDYMRQTGPTSNIAPADGARLHVTLYRNIQSYLNRAPDDFRSGFGLLLRIMADQKKNGVFSPRFMFRFVPYMKLSNADRQGLELLFQSMADLSSNESRAAALTQVDIGKVTSAALLEDGAQRFISFFTA